MNNSERIYKFALWLLVLAIPLIILFLWGNTYTTDVAIDDSKFGAFGDFFGGVLGAIWSLCGVLLFYNALKAQTRDFATNREALYKQIDALQTQSQEFRLQREEFSLQRDELRQSRNVIIEQSKTLSQQRLDSVYFALLNLYNTITLDLNQQSESGNFFKDLKLDLHSLIIKNYGFNSSFEESRGIYLEVFYRRKEELTHYFRLVYRIIKTIDESNIEITEKFKYIKILRSQLSENEMLALYYNSHSDYGGESYKLILKFNVLKHLPIISKLEFYRYVWPVNKQGKLLIRHRLIDETAQLKRRSKFMQFNNEITSIIS